MLAAPANADSEHFGLLTVDSPEPNTLKEIDKRYLVLIAGVLATGLAQLRRDGVTLGQSGQIIRKAPK